MSVSSSPVHYQTCLPACITAFHQPLKILNQLPLMMFFFCRLLQPQQDAKKPTRVERHHATRTILRDNQTVPAQRYAQNNPTSTNGETTHVQFSRNRKTVETTKSIHIQAHVIRRKNEKISHVFLSLSLFSHIPSNQLYVYAKSKEHVNSSKYIIYLAVVSIVGYAWGSTSSLIVPKAYAYCATKRCFSSVLGASLFRVLIWDKWIAWPLLVLWVTSINLSKEFDVFLQKLLSSDVLHQIHTC